MRVRLIGDGLFGLYGFDSQGGDRSFQRGSMDPKGVHELEEKCGATGECKSKIICDADMRPHPPFFAQPFGQDYAMARLNWPKNINFPCIGCFFSMPYACDTVAAFTTEEGKDVFITGSNFNDARRRVCSRVVEY